MQRSPTVQKYFEQCCIWHWVGTFFCGCALIPHSVAVFWTVLYLALGGYIFLWLCKGPSQCRSILNSALSGTGRVHFSVAMQRSLTVFQYFEQCSIWHWVGTFFCGYAKIPHRAEVFWTVLYLALGGYVFQWLCKDPWQFSSILNSALSGTEWALFSVAMQGSLIV
jgi:hypothetical protein